MRIKAKMEIKHQYDDGETVKNYNPQEGDEINVPDPLGENWVKNGWAVNLDTGEDNEPSKDPVTLDIKNTQHGQTTTDL